MWFATLFWMKSDNSHMNNGVQLHFIHYMMVHWVSSLVLFSAACQRTSVWNAAGNVKSLSNAFNILALRSLNFHSKYRFLQFLLFSEIFKVLLSFQGMSGEHALKLIHPRQCRAKMSVQRSLRSQMLAINNQNIVLPKTEQRHDLVETCCWAHPSFWVAHTIGDSVMQMFAQAEPDWLPATGTSFWWDCRS